MKNKKLIITLIIIALVAGAAVFAWSKLKDVNLQQIHEQRGKGLHN